MAKHDKRKDSTAPQLDPHKWKPGQSGNPAGRARGALKKSDIEAQIGKMWGMSPGQLAAIAKDPNSTAGDAMIAAIMSKAIETGDYSRMEGLLQRGVGKVKDVVETHNVNAPAEDLEEIPTEKLLKAVGNG